MGKRKKERMREMSRGVQKKRERREEREERKISGKKGGKHVSIYVCGRSVVTTKRTNGMAGRGKISFLMIFI